MKSFVKWTKKDIKIKNINTKIFKTMTRMQRKEKKLITD